MVSRRARGHTEAALYQVGGDGLSNQPGRAENDKIAHVGFDASQSKQVQCARLALTERILRKLTCDLPLRNISPRMSLQT